jgi:hypothetical protein
MRRSKDELLELVHFFCGANFWKILVLRCYMNSVQNLAVHMQEGSERSKISEKSNHKVENHAQSIMRLLHRLPPSPASFRQQQKRNSATPAGRREHRA